MAEIIELNESNTCKICLNAIGKYVCPKCNILYCSLNCYRSETHQNCSEQFYKNSVLEELKLNENNPEDQLKMLSILKSTENYSEISDEPMHLKDADLAEHSDNSYDSDDDKEARSLQERLAGIDLDDAEQVWASLDDDEKKEFLALTQDYKAKNIVQSWTPWWFHSQSKIQEVGPNSSSYKTNCPIIGDITKFKDICKQNPHVTVKFNLYNILAGYAFVTRYFNGEHSLFPKETVSFIASISSSLGSHQNFTNLESAFEAVESKIIEKDWIVCELNNISVTMNDLKKIVSGPSESDQNHYVLAAICDIYNLLKKSVSKKGKNDEDGISRAFVDEHFPSSIIHSLKEMKLYMKRIEYFLSYVQNYYTK